jgi:hypothetical protein
MAATSHTISDSALSRLHLVASTVLLQAVDMLNTQVTEDAQLVYSSKHIPGSTIGKHLRHATDHFQLLLDCISRPKPHVFSYDVRVRGLPMESSRLEALTVFDDVLKKLDSTVPNSDLSLPLTLNAVTPFEQARHHLV